jgi:hypothetical protein
MMRRVIIAKDALPIADVGIGIVNADGITQLGADHFIEVEVRVIPEKDATSH